MSRAASRQGPPAPRELRRWITSQGSLSARLAASCERFTVRLLRQGRAPAWPDEARALGLAPRQPVHRREVLLCCDGEPVVLARSVVAAPAARRTWRALRGLGNRPLADLLFADRRLRRSPLSLLRFAPSDPLAPRRSQWVRREWLAATGRDWGAAVVWARRSQFQRRGMPLLVMECFAPALRRRLLPRQR